MNVIGAGIAGLCSSINLISEGHNINLFEINSFAGGHAYENIQTIRNYDHKVDFIDDIKNKGLDIKHLEPIYSIDKYSPSFKKITIYSKKTPLFYSFKRGLGRNSITTQLLNQAERVGVKTHFNEKVRSKKGDIIAWGHKYETGWIYGAHYKDLNITDNSISLFLMRFKCFMTIILLNPISENTRR